MDGLIDSSTPDSIRFDLAQTPLRTVNHFLHHHASGQPIQILNPNGAHNIAVGLDRALTLDIRGHTGYYTGGLNKLANITIHGNVGTGVGENMMSGRIHVKGFASVSAGASAHGGLLVIDGNASLRCGISLKGADIVVGGSVGSFSAFMAQAGHLVICGDAGDALGDALYDAVIYIRGQIKSLGADAQLEPMTDRDHAIVRDLLTKAGLNHNPQDFQRIASAKQLYHWNANANQTY